MITLIIVSGNTHQWVLKSVGKNLTRDGIFILPQSIPHSPAMLPLNEPKKFCLFREYPSPVSILYLTVLNFLMFKLVLEKAEEPEIKLPTSAASWKKQESSRKTSISALLTMPKPLTVWITINCGKF